MTNDQMKALFFATTFILLSACDYNKAETVTYKKDHRTDLCFAQYFNGNATSVTNVPCTPAVERLINEK